MKDPILKQLKSLNNQEKQDLFFDFLSSKTHDLIQIKNKEFKATEYDILNAFMEADFDIHLKSILGNNHLFFVKSKAAAQLLIQKGANVNVRNKFEETPLFYAKSKEIAEVLIQHGADVNARNNIGETPLFEVKSKEIAEVLIQYGADMEVSSYNGYTALHWNNSQEIIEILIQHGADMDAKNNKNQIPAECQRYRKCDDIANFIEQKMREREIKLEQEKLNQTLPHSSQNLNHLKPHI